MTKICLLLASIAFISVSSVLSQTEWEVKAQFESERAIGQGFQRFFVALDWSSHDVAYYKEAIYNLLPSIQGLQRVYSFAAKFFSVDSFNLNAAKDEFRQMTKQINQIELAVGRFLFEDPPSTNATLLKWYKHHRAPISAVEENVRLLAGAATIKERQYFLRTLDEECQQSNPARFFNGYPQSRSISRAEALAILSEGHDRNKLIKWVKLMTGDAVRAMTMQQVCMGIWHQHTTSAQALDTAWAKLSEIFDDLKKEADRLVKYRADEIGYAAHTQLAQFSKDIDMVSLANNLGKSLDAKYPTKIFGVFVLGGVFERLVFDSRRAVEIPFGKVTILLFWEERGQTKNKTQQDQVKVYLESIPCVNEYEYGNYRVESLRMVSEQLRRFGATAVVVTDANYASRVYYEVTMGSRKKCDASKGSPKSTWQYTRAFIVGY